MAFSSDSGGGRPMAEINVTPLVDVMLVLLIIFMITAPLLTQGIEINLPETGAEALPGSDEPVTKGVIESRFSVEAQRTPQPQVNVRGDKTAKYKLVQEVVQIAQNQGMRKVGFVAIKDRSGQQ